MNTNHAVPKLKICLHGPKLKPQITFFVFVAETPSVPKPYSRPPPRLFFQRCCCALFCRCVCHAWTNYTQTDAAIEKSGRDTKPLGCDVCSTSMLAATPFHKIGEGVFVHMDPTPCWEAGEVLDDPTACYKCGGTDASNRSYSNDAAAVRCEACFFKLRRSFLKKGRAFVIGKASTPTKKTGFAPYCSPPKRARPTSNGGGTSSS